MGGDEQWAIFAQMLQQKKPENDPPKVEEQDSPEALADVGQFESEDVEPSKRGGGRGAEFGGGLMVCKVRRMAVLEAVKMMNILVVDQVMVFQKVKRLLSLLTRREDQREDQRFPFVLFYSLFPFLPPLFFLFFPLFFFPFLSPFFSFLPPPFPSSLPLPNH